MLFSALRQTAHNRGWWQLNVGCCLGPYWLILRRPDFLPKNSRIKDAFADVVPKHSSFPPNVRHRNETSVHNNRIFQPTTTPINTNYCKSTAVLLHELKLIMHCYANCHIDLPEDTEWRRQRDHSSRFPPSIQKAVFNDSADRHVVIFSPVMYALSVYGSLLVKAAVDCCWCFGHRCTSEINDRNSKFGIETRASLSSNAKVHCPLVRRLSYCSKLAPMRRSADERLIGLQRRQQIGIEQRIGLDISTGNQQWKVDVMFQSVVWWHNAIRLQRSTHFSCHELLLFRRQTDRWLFKRFPFDIVAWRLSLRKIAFCFSKRTKPTRESLRNWGTNALCKSLVLIFLFTSAPLDSCLHIGAFYQIAQVWMKALYTCMHVW